MSRSSRSRGDLIGRKPHRLQLQKIELLIGRGVSALYPVIARLLSTRAPRAVSSRHRLR
jgi:hypothetical protein